MNWTLLQNSLLLAGAATVLAVGAGFLVALWAWGVGSRVRWGIAVLAGLTLALPPFLVTNCWLDLLGHTGVLRPYVPWSIYSLGGAVWVLALMHWPVTLFLLWGAWLKLEAGQMELEPLLRGTAFVRWLLLPSARPALGAATALTFALTLNNFAVPAILQVKVFPGEMWVSYSTQLNAWEAFGLSWPMLLVPLGLWFWLGKNEVSWPRLSGGVSTALFRSRLGGWFVVGAAVGMGVLALSFVVPMVQVSASARTWRELPGALAAGQRAVGLTVGWSVLTATGVVLMALFTWTRRMGALAWAAFFVPGVLLGMALIVLLNRPVLEVVLRSPLIVVLALALRYLAPGWSTVAQAMRSRDRDLVEAARLAGMGGWLGWRQLTWPLVGPRLAAAWYLTYVLCLWDVETLVLIMPPGYETVSLRVFNLLHYGYASQVNALCLALLLLASAPLVVWGGVRMASAWGGRGRVGARLACVCLALVVAVGCQPRGEGRVAIPSRLFSEVQIIGSRGTGPGQFNKPRSLAIDAQDNVYVADMTGRVQKFRPDGTFVLAWEMPQTDLGKAKGMARDSAGNIVVVEPHYARVNHFDPAGRLVFQWGSQGTNAGQLSFPRAVAMDPRGELWVSEYAKAERVQRFSADGRRFLVGVGRSGEGPGELARAEGIGVDAQGRLYVADSCNHRIQVFDAGGRWLRAHGKAGQGAGELSYPYDICVDRSGRQYVCEFGNSRIQVFDEADRVLEIMGGPGSGPGQFSNPWAIALDSAGNLYVADALNHRVQKFIRRPGTWAPAQMNPLSHSPNPNRNLTRNLNLDPHPTSLVVLAIEDDSRGASSSPSSPFEERVGRGPRRGVGNKNGPPLPGLLLHPMEEREGMASLMQSWDDSRRPSLRLGLRVGVGAAGGGSMPVWNQGGAG